MHKTFPELFKKYRLKAEFETLASFGNALAERGLFYEDSMFSHWQKGARVPTDRSVTLEIIKLFIERNSITTIADANEFLASAQQGFLTDQEIATLPKLENQHAVFQIPREIVSFTGREDILQAFLEDPPYGKVILIDGPAGVGKTTLAIKLGHTLQTHFPDGVLWYRADTTDTKDILASILHSFNQTIHKANDIDLLSSSVRSFLTNKKVLLILDNCEEARNIHSLIPNSANCGVILLSRYKNLNMEISESISLKIFTKKEIHTLFTKIFDATYVKKYQADINQLTDRVGDLPLAVNIFAKQLHQSEITPKDLLNQLEKEKLSLQKFSYEKKNLFLAINMSYKNLSPKTQSVFLSFGVFKGRDFSTDAIASINGLSMEKTRSILYELFNASLIEDSIGNKFRIHPMVKQFISEKLNNPYVFILLRILTVLFVLFSIFWFYNQTFSNRYWILIFGSSYFIVALFGGLLGLYISQKWGGAKSNMGRAILFLSFGLFAQTFGQIAYSYYGIFYHIEVPYPSIGDVGYFGTMPIYIYAMLCLAKATGARIKISDIKPHSKILLTTISLLVFEYILLLQQYIFYWSTPLRIFLDFAVPFGDMIYVYLASLIYIKLKETNKSAFRNKVVLIVIALIMQLLAEYTFIYQASTNTYSLGKIDDYLFFFSYVLMTFSLIRLNTQMSKLMED